MTEEDEDSSTPEEAAEQVKKRAEKAVEQTNKFHEQLGNMKEWGNNTSSELAAQAQMLYDLGVLDEGERDEIEQQANRIRTVAQRITG